MGAQENLALVKRLYSEFLSGNDLDSADQFYASNFKLLDPAVPSCTNLNAVKQLEKTYNIAFPNKTLKIDDIWAMEGDRVLVRWTCQATQKGVLQDIPASNKNVKFSGLSLYRISNDKITEIVQFWDRLGLLEQIGAIQTLQALHR